MIGEFFGPARLVAGCTVVRGNGFASSAMRRSASSAPSSATGFCIASELIHSGVIGLVINATIGAIVLLLALRLTARADGAAASRLSKCSGACAGTRTAR